MLSAKQTGLWASARHRVVRPTVNNRDAQVLRHVNRSRLRTDIPLRVSNLEGDGIYPTVGGIPAFGSYLHRLAISRNYDVVEGIAIIATILSFVTGYLLD